MDRLPARVLPAGTRPLPAVPHAVPPTTAGGVHGRRIALLGHSLAEPGAFAERLDALRLVEWVVYAKRPFAGPEQVLAYLGRYTHRVAMANSRLIRLADGQVDFTWKDYRHHGRQRRWRWPRTSSSGGSCCTPCRTGSTHPPCRLPRERPSHREAGAVPRLARGPDARPANAGELPRSHPSADPPRTRCLPRLWRRDAGARAASALSAAAHAILVRQLMIGNQPTRRTEWAATPTSAPARPGAGR